MTKRSRKLTTKPTRDALAALDRLAVVVADLHLGFADMIASPVPSDGQRMVVAGLGSQAVEHITAIMASLSAVAAVVDPAAFAEASA